MSSMRDQFLEKVAAVKRLAAEEGVHMNRIGTRALAAQWATQESSYITWSDPTGEQAVRRVIRQQVMRT